MNLKKTLNNFLTLPSLLSFYNQDALGESYYFSSSSIYYQITPEEGYNGYRNYIKTLPIEEPTEIFSMHDNANITFAQKETYTLFENLTALMPRSAGGGKSAAAAKKVKTTEEQLTESAQFISKCIERGEQRKIC